MNIVTGVIDANTVSPDLWDDCIDLDYEQYCLEHKDDPDFDPLYEPDNPTYIYGFKKDNDGKYDVDPDAKYSFIINSNEGTMQVVHSKYYAKCAWCSPCYPNQGDLDTEGDVTAYTLPPDCFEEDRPPKLKPLPIQE